jgi:MYXO-CTERM domain-containing protein
MPYKVTAVFMVFCLAGFASAGTIDVSLVPVDTSAAGTYTDLTVNPAQWAAAGYQCYDLQITVTDDTWTTASCEAVLEGATFWNHPNGSEKEPSAGMFPYFGLLRYDSFWTTTEEWPNPDLNPAADATTFAPGSPLAATSTHRKAEWYVDPLLPRAYGGVYTIARFTILPTSPDWRLYMWGGTYLASTGGDPHPYAVPEPSGLGLLILGGLALLRRRD